MRRTMAGDQDGWGKLLVVRMVFPPLVAGSAAGVVTGVIRATLAPEMSSSAVFVMNLGATLFVVFLLRRFQQDKRTP